MTHDLSKMQPRPVSVRFELAAARLADQWIANGAVTVTAGDIALAREYLEQVGWRVQQVQGLLVRLTDLRGQSEELSREQVVLTAMRELARLR